MRHSNTNYLLCAVLALSAIPAFAQDSAAYQACNEKAKTQIDMNACAGQEADRADAKLNTAYRQLLSKAASEQNAVPKIKTAERAWISYRDAYLEAMYPATDKQLQYGSMYGMDLALLRARLTGQHLSDVQDLLKQYSDDSRAEPPQP